MFLITKVTTSHTLSTKASRVSCIDCHHIPHSLPCTRPDLEPLLHLESFACSAERATELTLTLPQTLPHTPTHPQQLGGILLRRRCHPNARDVTAMPHTLIELPLFYGRTLQRSRERHTFFALSISVFLFISVIQFLFLSFSLNITSLLERLQDLYVLIGTHYSSSTKALIVLMKL